MPALDTDEITARVQKMLDEHTAAGTIVAGWEEIKKILTEAHLAWRMMMIEMMTIILKIMKLMMIEMAMMRLIMTMVMMKRIMRMMRMMMMK